MLLALGFSAAILLGPEKPLSAPRIDAAAGDQLRPSLAWYGNSLAATWIDTRYSDPDARIAQLDRVGRPTGFAQRAYGSISNARLASAGAITPLLATDNGGGTYVGPAGTSGRGVPGSLVDLITNGDNYLLLTGDTALTASILDATGEEIAKHVLPALPSFPAVAVAGATAYHVVHIENDCGAGCAPAIHDTVVQSNRPSSDQLIASNIAAGTQLAAATSNNAFLIAWTTESSIEILVLTSARQFVGHTSIPVGTHNLYAVSDGHEFLVAWHDSDALRAVRIDESAQKFEAFDLASSTASDLTFARTPSTIVLAWSEGTPRNIYTRGAASLSAISSTASALASKGYAEQKDLSLADDLPVWVEGERGDSVRNGDGELLHATEGMTLADPIAVRGGGTLLVAAVEQSAEQRRIIARVGDDSPIVIGPGTSFDASFDGASFVIFWTDGHLHRTRIAASSAVLDTTEIESGGNVSSVRAMDGALVFVDGKEVVYDSGAVRRPVTTAITAASHPALAKDDQGATLIVWIDNGCLTAAHSIDNGPFLVSKSFCSA